MKDNMNDELKQFYNDHLRKQGLQLSEQAKANVKGKIFANLGNQLVADEPVSFLTKLRSGILKTYVLVPLVCLVFITGTTIASANSLPGDTLYGVKRQVENARLLIAPTEEAKLELKVNFAKKRLDEAEKINRNNSLTKSQVNDKNSDKDKDKGNGGDGNNLQRDDSSDRDSQSQHQEQRQIKAREEADHALEFLNKTKEDWEEKGKEQKARDIEDRLEKFHEDEHDRDDGEVRGDNSDSHNSSH